MIKIIISSFMATLGFGILFNIKGKKLIFAGIGGAIGGVLYHLGLNLGLSNMMAMFTASVGFSLYSEILARICKTPVTTFVICALIPLVPGGGMYRMMLQAIQGDVMQALTIGLETLSIAGVLVLGILLVSTIMKAIYKPKRCYKVGEQR
ncbi:MAG: threonine/serine exporter family protein [Longicatena sp.]